MMLKARILVTVVVIQVPVIQNNQIFKSCTIYAVD